MPFKSTSQIGKFKKLVEEGKMSQATFDEWMKNTPKGLPERITVKKAPTIKHVQDLKDHYKKKYGGSHG